MNTFATPEIIAARAKNLADAKLDFSLSPAAVAPNVLNFDQMLAKLKASVTPSLPREVFLLALTVKGLPPAWGDAIASEVGVTDFEHYEDDTENTDEKMRQMILLGYETDRLAIYRAQLVA